MNADDIIKRLNEWRAELVENIADEPPFTDDLNGPVRNLPPLEGDDLAMIRIEVEMFLDYCWPGELIVKYMKYSEEVCPFWTEEYAIKRMHEVRSRALLQGARR
jgi:hypothetical protein